MSQYKKHPIDIALEGLSPILAPSFTLSSVRDIPEKNKKYPLIEYVIVGSQNINFDQTRQQWRNQSYVVLDFLLKESSPLDWCKYEELEQAKDLHSLQWHLEKLIQHFITLLVNPKSVYKSLNPSDMIWGEYDFKLENFIGSQGLYKHSEHKLTGVSVQFVLSYWSNDNCCIIDCANINQLKRLKDVTKTNSVSWKLLANETGCPIPTRCELILQGLTTNDKLTCILPTYDFSDAQTQEALTDQQDTDIIEYAIPIANCTQLRNGLSYSKLLCLLDLYDFSNAPTQAALTSQQKEDLKPVVVPLLDYTAGFDDDFNLFSTQQKTDLSSRLCGAAFDYSFNLSGVNQYIMGESGGVYNLEYNNAFSYFTWINRNNATRQPLLCKLTGNTGYCFEVTASNKLRFIIIGGAYISGRAIDIETTANVPTGVLLSLGFTYTGSGLSSGMKLYINGVSQSFNVLREGFNSFSMLNPANIEILGVTTASLFANAKVNNCRMWNIALSDPSAITEGIGTSGKPNNTAVNAANLILDTDFDNSVFGLDTFAISDLSGASSGLKTINMPFSTRYIEP